MPSKSRLVEALEKRGRYTKTVDMSSVLGKDLVDHDGSSIAKIQYRINTKADDDAAIIAAYATISRLADRAEGGREEVKKDPAILADAKFIQALWRACRKPEDEKEELFITPDWMKENLDTDTIAGLLNGYNEVRAQKLGIPIDIDAAFVGAIRQSCVSAYGTDLPETVLCGFVREVLSRILIIMSKTWDDERNNARLLTQTFLKHLEEGDDKSKEIMRSACEAFLRSTE